MDKGGSDIRGNSEKARAKGRLKKGKKHKITQLKDKIGVDRTNNILNQIDKNIEEFLAHKDDKIRLDATKAFTDYYKPKKKNIEVNSNLRLDKMVTSDDVDKAIEEERKLRDNQ